jgi:hypothetical protein
LEVGVGLEVKRKGFHPTTLVYVRQRLIDPGKADVAMRAVLAALQKEVFAPKRS